MVILALLLAEDTATELLEAGMLELAGATLELAGATLELAGATELTAGALEAGAAEETAVAELEVMAPPPHPTKEAVTSAASGRVVYFIVSTIVIASDMGLAKGFWVVCNLV
jgi:hypothetical protein